MRRETEFIIEGLSAFRVIDKLNRAGIAVLSARKTKKNAVCVRLYSKDAKKGFAILKNSCYNVKKVSPKSVSRLLVWGKKSAGLVLGAAIFLGFVALAQTRVLAVRVVGSGAYYAGEVNEILRAHGVKKMSATPKENLVSAEILSLPRVCFCSLKNSGGVLTVTVEVSDESTALSREPLTSPATGKVEELVVVRGTALVQVGDEVREGDTVVKGTTLVGETEREVIVIARVKVSYSFCAEYALESEEAARAQAELDYGEIRELHIEKTGNGYLATGTAFAEASVNLS